MEKAFTMQQYMVGKQRCHLAKTLNLHENQVSDAQCSAHPILVIAGG